MSVFKVKRVKNGKNVQKRGVMFNEIYKNSDGSMVADYMKGFLPPKRESEIHCHEEYEFLLIVNGEITYADNKGVIK